MAGLPPEFGRILDVRYTARMPDIVADVEANVGVIDVLVNNAGFPSHSFATLTSG